MTNRSASPTVGNPNTGWLVQSGQRYYTGELHNPLLQWSPFLKFAKVYKHQKWAQKAALRLGGQAVPRASLTVPNLPSVSAVAPEV
jgi:hypothetical protein